MNFALKREIYGANAWCIDALSYGSLSQILKDNRNGVVLELPETKPLLVITTVMTIQKLMLQET
jgi:hypothetical protein